MRQKPNILKICVYSLLVLVGLVLLGYFAG